MLHLLKERIHDALQSWIWYHRAGTGVALPGLCIET
jgi:hypothetical protein